jgi:hypothetical protein
MFWKLDLFLTLGGKGGTFFIHLDTLKGADINY